LEPDGLADDEGVGFFFLTERAWHREP
jgi:hypothetical protein